MVHIRRGSFKVLAATVPTHTKRYSMRASVPVLRGPTSRSNTRQPNSRIAGIVLTAPGFIRIYLGQESDASPSGLPTFGTAGMVIVEASPYDRVWGIGLRQTDRRAMDPRQWRGTNLLGFVLMDVRDEVG